MTTTGRTSTERERVVMSPSFEQPRDRARVNSIPAVHCLFKRKTEACWRRRGAMTTVTGAEMERGGVRIVDTFAEAFDMRAARVLITAQSPGWARTAAQSMTGFATSVIGCKVEAGIEAELTPEETPDGRPGVSVLMFGFDAAGLGSRLVDRVGQTVLTCPTTACFDGLPARGRSRGRRRTAAPFRRQVPIEQGSRRCPLLADPGDGGRVPGAGSLRHPTSHRRRQFPDSRYRSTCGARGGGSGGRRDAQGPWRRAAVPRRDRPRRAARSAPSATRR